MEAATNQNYSQTETFEHFMASMKELRESHKTFKEKSEQWFEQSGDTMKIVIPEGFIPQDW
jgi:hypothetical protein